MYTLVRFLLTRTHAVLPILIVGLLAGCDLTDSDPSEPGAAVTFQGRITDNDGFGKTAGAVEGALVTAATVSADGSLHSVPGQTTTDAEGRFTLEAEESAHVMVLTSTKEGFESQVLVVVDGETSGAVQTMPMTTETKIEANVFLAVGVGDGASPDTWTVADVAAYVNTELAIAVESGTTSAAEVAAGLRAAVRAEANYFAEEEAVEGSAFDEVRGRKQDAFATLQVQLASASSAQAETEILQSFERAIVEAYAESGISFEAQARARQSSQTALMKFFTTGSTETRFALRKQATVLTALTTGHAIEAVFEEEGASETRVNAIVAARNTLIADLRAASSEQVIEEAVAQFESTVEAELANELDVNAATLEAVEVALAPVKATLNASVDVAASAESVASAYATFFTTAQTTVETTLTTSNNTTLGARVLVLLSAE